MVSPFQDEEISIDLKVEAKECWWVSNVDALYGPVGGNGLKLRWNRPELPYKKFEETGNFKYLCHIGIRLIWSPFLPPLLNKVIIIAVLLLQYRVVISEDLDFSSQKKLFFICCNPFANNYWFRIKRLLRTAKIRNRAVSPAPFRYIKCLSQ